MDFLSSIMACLVLLSLALFLPVAYGQQLVPALFIFGDSVVDVGNNNNLRTLVKANFAPYGRDFVNHTATGRFSNGKIAIDFIAKRLLFTSYQPPYLNKSNATTRNLLIGANFASAASGYYEETANIFLAIPLSKQLEHYKEYQEEVVELVGAENASLIFSRGVHILSTGNSDFVQNYYINPVLNIALTSEQFSNVLVQKYAQFIEELYGLGARKIGVTTLPPIGCLPAVITLFGFGQII
ncbi:GDSL esterase/lipase At5g03820 [Morus notabilis]|uniref:GDSL esterase/lipase At5g03820 n=1 Tax=Morus notabilis TaxID=981085 RepID=UPI000CED1B67|nr:GDSL esterase/lipase At5g03820 [Morus notabilis]